MTGSRKIQNGVKDRKACSVQDMAMIGLSSIDQKAMALVLARHEPGCQALIKPEDVPVLVAVLGGDLKQAYLKTEKKYLELLSATKSD